MTQTHGINGNKCDSTQLPGSWGIEYPEAVAFAVDKVNNEFQLLPNISLGFYILDDCEMTSMAVAQSLSFIVQPAASCHLDSCFHHTLSDSLDSDLDVPFYDVIGVVAPMTSIATVSISYLYTIAKMPIVGYITSSEELSNKDLHPLFFRVIGPDNFQADAMIKFVFQMGWSYISIVYSQGTYGERGFESLKSSASRYNICIATSHKVDETDATDLIASDLFNHVKARVVILFAEELQTKHVLNSVVKLNAIGQFIWISSDSIFIASKESISEHADIFVGAFVFFFYSPLLREFYDYVKKQNFRTTRNPWFKTAWEYLTNCSFSKDNCVENVDILRSPKFEFMPTTTLLIDAILTFANAAHNLIRELCPSAQGHDARACISRVNMVNYLKNVSFTGYTGAIQFDNNGDSGGRYVIYQLAYDSLNVPLGYGDPNSTLRKGLVMKEVANYDRSTGTVQYTEYNISWANLIQKERIVPLMPGNADSGIPESVCSRPCVAGEYKIQKELACCWECRRCRDNERIVNKNTSCEECPEFTWPDPLLDFTTCTEIRLTYYSTSDTLSILLITLATLTSVLTIFIAVFYHKFRELQVIKASSRELSFIQLLAILTGYINVISFQTLPSDISCVINFFLFCISFSALYAPLLMKTIRIYRIFKTSVENIKGLHFISPISQVCSSSALIVVQICLCVAVFSISSPSAKRSQLVRTEPFVELACDLTFLGLTSFLAYNIILVILCAIFAFKTRKLPDNFNESRFISMCVSTTLVIWLAFVPTYFTAGMEYIRILILSVALLLNHTVALVMLYLPKLYAAIYIPSESVRTNRFNSPTRLHVPRFASTNRVAPSLRDMDNM
nr:metabotropic glutamate receptor 4-like [Biomphalaria glabrata]